MKSTRFLLFVICFFFFGFSQAQENVRKVTRNGKEYYVYPYKHSLNGSAYSYSGEYTGYDYNPDNAIVPYPGSLPDGDYIMYYEAISRYHKKRWFFKRRYEYVDDTTVVYAEFSLKNNSKEGHAAFYESYESLKEEGNFVNNEREGKWKKYLYKSVDWALGYTGNYGYEYDYNYDTYNYESVVEEYSYKNGIKEGEFQCRIDAGKDSGTVVTIGNYKDNAETGDWKFYFVNKNLAKEYSLTDSLGEKILLGYTNDYDPYNYNYGSIYHGWLKVYYPNGQLKSKSYYKNGYKSQLDTGYYHTGKYNWLNTEKTEYTDKDTNVYYDLKQFDTLGHLVSHAYQKNGSQVFAKSYANNKLYYEVYSSDYYSNAKNLDTLVILSRTYDVYTDTSQQKLTEIQFKHLETEITLTRNLSDYYLYGYEMDDFKFHSDNASNIYYVEEIDHQGQNKEFTTHTYRHYYRGKFYDFNNQYYSEIDSVKIMVDGKPFSGEYVERQGIYKKKTGKVKLKDDKITFYTYQYGGRNEYGGWSFGYRSKNKLMIAYDYNPRRRWLNFKRKTTYSVKGNYMDGIKQGVWTGEKNKNGLLMEKETYDKGMLQGKAYSYGFQYTDKWSDCRDVVDKKITKKKGLWRKNRYFLSSVREYVNGESNGMHFTYHCNGRLSSKAEYKDDYMHGLYEYYNSDGEVTKRCNYLNGFYNGKYEEWSGNGKIRYDLNFEEGVLVGEYKYYFFNGKMSYNGMLQNGFKIGEWLTYFDEGNVKYKEIYTIEDSTFYSFGSNYYNSSAENVTYYHTLNSCYSMQYYPTGELAAEGKILRNSRNGLWKFYDEGGKLVKQINYEYKKIPVTKSNGKTDSLYTYGYYESWNSSGNKESEAYVLSETSKFDCYQEVSVMFQDLYYINFWDKEGNQTLKDKTGRIKTYHGTTGKVESEGEMQNGLRTGYWRFYDPEGKLHEVGNYKDGERNGKWLFGDLEGMHYLDDACYDITDPRIIEEMELKKKKLSIYEVVYKNGKSIKSHSFEVDLNK